MIAALVPVKALSASKSRLLPQLGREAAERLSVAMLADIVAALRATPGLERVAVVTPDERVAAAARDAGAEPLLRDDPGLNASIEGGGGEIAPAPDDALLVVLGDVAGVRAEELERLLREAPERGVALAPSSDGGTSALLRRPRDVIGAAFGEGSAKRHRELAESAGVPYREIALPSLAVDIDEPADLAAFLASRGAGERTRALLRELGVGRDA